MRVICVSIVVMVLALGIAGQGLVPFDADVKELPPGFIGHDAKTMFRLLAPLALEVLGQCGEFEKRANCQERLNSLYDRQLAPRLTARALLAFSVTPKCEYFADPEYLTCEPADLSALFGGGDIMWSHRLVQSRQYLAQTAFGVKFPAEYKKYENVHIVTSGFGTRIHFKLSNLSPAAARQLKPNLRFLIIGDPVTPFAKSEAVSYPATLKEPTQIDGDNLSVLIDLKEIWIYDITTGKIWAKH